MKREFFGVDVSAALERASSRLGIPVTDLRYETLDHTFHPPIGGEQVAILVDYDPAGAPVASDPDASFDEVIGLKADPVRMGAVALERMLQKIGFDCQVETTTEESTVLLSVQFEGQKPDFRRGEIRELRGALQYLINRIAGASRDSELRYLIDFTGNIDARRQVMASLADELSDKVLALQNHVHVQLMDSQDRRLLHLSLVDHEQVSTASDGDGRFRVLSVSPKQMPASRSADAAGAAEKTPAAGGSGVEE